MAAAAKKCITALASERLFNFSTMDKKHLGDTTYGKDSYKIETAAFTSEGHVYLKTQPGFLIMPFLQGILEFLFSEVNQQAFLEVFRANPKLQLPSSLEKAKTLSTKLQVTFSILFSPAHFKIFIFIFLVA